MEKKTKIVLFIKQLNGIQADAGLRQRCSSSVTMNHGGFRYLFIHM